MSSAFRVPHLARLALAATWLAALALQPASADPLPARNGFPTQTVKFISPFPPGGGNDATARLVTTRLPEIMGQAAVVDNRGGAGGNIGAKTVAESKPDGYTVLTSQVSIMAVNPTLYASAGFDPIKNFIPITQINAAPLALVVDANSALKSFADLATKAKATPGKVTYATPGNGTLSHLVGVVLAKDNGIDMTHVPYKGAGPALTDLLGGQVDVLVTSTASVAGLVQNGKLRVLAVTSPRRIGVFAKSPTLEELGYAGARFEDWYGFFAPAGTPPERVAYLNEAIVRTLRLPEVTKLVNDGGSEVVANSSDAFAAQLKLDIDRWSRIVKLSGAKAD
ncbi:tripartite-type tricarboxylate transporter receptor subunit TctC [Variovorax boronicumulans]|uniref:Tripartite-type tricarboxylate transporter receptor subunit TctC n=1 Tax=Variovorax boronicumulans TaxID=436515 RepID=A0AAW8CZ14_9BURK|nr:tripartite tricarboxylate transporter substrate binding protein [Variovorax boronicumulans]MDP9894090.1 tripartite-type tricarboxylate transporter receptor subunit TctC [Variovorax boronicumulans]MDQ0053909.1 tripartite-type tricarboxylate transporter receptor subunit TctC [Variovorax boronicumulans]